MDGSVSATPAPFLQALFQCCGDGGEGGDVILAKHNYICTGNGVHLDPADYQQPNPDLPQAPYLSSSFGQPVELQVFLQVPCTLAKQPSLFNPLGMTMEGIRSSAVSPRPDVIEQIFVCLSVIEHRMYDIQAVVPLPKGLPSKVKGLSKHHLHKCRWDTPSPPLKHHRAPQVTEFSSSDEGPQ